MTIIGEIRARPEEFASAVAWVAKWAPAKPVDPIQAGIAIAVADGELSLTAYGENAVARARVAAEATRDAGGTAIVSGRLLAALAATFGPRNPVTIAADQDAVRLSAGRWTGRLPVMNEQDWPTLNTGCPAIGYCPGDALAEAVGRAGAARGVNPDAGAVFMLMHLSTAGDRLDLAATDRYRVAFASAPFRSVGEPVELTPFADVMADAAAAFAGPGEVELGTDGHQLSLTGARRQIVMRLGSVDGGWPIDLMRKQLDMVMQQTGSVEIDREQVAMPLKRAGITGGKESHARVRIDGDGLHIGGAAEGTDGDETVPVDYDGEPTAGHFNAKYLGDLFATAPDKVVTLRFTAAANLQRAAVAYCENDPTWRYITMPVRKVG